MPGLRSRTILQAQPGTGKCRPNYSKWLPKYSSWSHFVFRYILLIFVLCFTFMVIFVTAMAIGYCNDQNNHTNAVLKQTAVWYTKGKTIHRNDTLTPKRQGIHRNGTKTVLFILTTKTNLSIPVTVVFRLINFENVEKLNTTLYQFMIMMKVRNHRKKYVLYVSHSKSWSNYI